MSDLIKDTGGTPSENGSNSSSNGEVGGGNNSDNSALVSLGNTSFGFNFESDGGFNNSSGTNSEEGNSEGGDGYSDQGGETSNNPCGDDSNNNQKPEATDVTTKKEYIENKDESENISTNVEDPSGNQMEDCTGTKIEAGTEAGTSSMTVTAAASAFAETSSQIPVQPVVSTIGDKGSVSQDQKESHQELIQASDEPSGTTNKIGEVNTMTAGAAAAKISSGSMKPPPPSSLSTALPPISSSASAFSVGSAGTSGSVAAASMITQSSLGYNMVSNNSSHTDAASAAIANLNSIATAATERIDDDDKRGLKRKASGSAADDDSGGYNSDDDEKGKVSSQVMSNASVKVGAAAAIANASTAPKDQGIASMKNPEGIESNEKIYPAAAAATEVGAKKGGGKKKKLDDNKREERNAREKERSFRISRQINDLRNLLSSGGVIVPKGTKSSVLTEAANYIRMLQQHQYRSEIDRHQLVQQVQRIGSGALGQQAATAVRHVAAQNGVWSLGNFGGIPPKSAMMYHQPGATTGSFTDEGASSSPEGIAANGSPLSSRIEESDYRHVFNSCTVAMGIASMGGAFIDCNKLFCQLSNYTKQEVCSMTVFNLTARQDLQSAFDLISQMLSAPLDPTASTSCVLRGAVKNRTDIGLNVKLIKGNDGVAKCFCITLIMNPASPYDTSKPVPATLAMVTSNTNTNTGQVLPSTKESQAGLALAPAYTTG